MSNGKKKHIGELPIHERVFLSRTIDDLERYQYALEGVKIYLEWEENYKDSISFTDYFRSQF